MNIFLSYKQTGLNKDYLDEALGNIRETLNNLNIKNYIYYFDENINNPAKEILKIAKNNIIDSDLVIGFINHTDKSEGQLLELGISEGLNKKILLLINKKVKNNYFLSYGLKSDIIYFNNISDIKNLLIDYLKGI